MDDTRPANVYVLNAKICVVHYHLRSGVLGMGTDPPGLPQQGIRSSDLKVIPLSIRCAKDHAAVRWASKARSRSPTPFTNNADAGRSKMAASVAERRKGQGCITSIVTCNRRRRSFWAKRDSFVPYCQISVCRM